MAWVVVWTTRPSGEQGGPVPAPAAPGVSGFDVLKTIRESESLRDIPVLILTVLGEAHYRERALELGATAFCPKPDDFSLITPVVQALLRGERVQA